MKIEYRDDSRERYMRRERKLRGMYRRRIFVVFLLALIVGIMLGWVICVKLTGGNQTKTEYVPEITATPTATQEPEPTWSDPFFDDEGENAEVTASPTPQAEPATAQPTEKSITAMDLLNATEEPMPEPTQEPTPEPTQEPTPAPTDTAKAKFCSGKARLTAVRASALYRATNMLSTML